MKKMRKKGVFGTVLLLVIIFSGCGSSESFSSHLSSGGGTGISNMFDSPAEMGVGDIMAIEFINSDEVEVDFKGVESGANFILAVGSYNYEGYSSTVTLAATDMSMPELNDPDSASKSMSLESEGAYLDDDDEYGANEILSAWLRASESTLSEVETPASFYSANTYLTKSMGIKASALGDVETFKVLNSLTSVSSYVNVDASVRCVGSNVVFYVDVEVPSSALSSDDIQTLCGDFDETAGAEMNLLGDIYDPDGDGKVHVLMTKQVNKLGSLGGGIITGYFYAGDYYKESASNPVSNYRDIIYTMVPDPNGSWGTTISRNFAMSNLLPAVLPHELQHAISYSVHVFENGGSSEESWLNEAMSHFIEDYFGVGNENPSRYAMYLASPSTYGIVTSGSPNLMERGGSYLFLRYLYEQSDDGDAFLRRLIDTKSVGVKNLEEAFDGASGMESFSQMMARWVISLIMTDRGISQDPRYVYKPRTYNQATGNYHGVCLDCDADDNRGTVLNGVNLNQYVGFHSAMVDASAAKFFEMTTLPNELTLRGKESDGNFGILVRTQ